MIEQDLYPWTDAAFTRIFKLKDRKAHAYLLAGHAGLGKTAFAIKMAKTLLCQNNEADACGQCQSCKLYQRGSHPDLHVLQSEKSMLEKEDIFSLYAPRYLEDEKKRKKRKNPSVIIAIDQVREVIPDIYARPHLSNCRIIVINIAENLNNNAANSLLKSLEEPPSESYFILISHSPGQLLATLRSRCNRIDFRIPDKETAISWLNQYLDDKSLSSDYLDQASGMPLKALDIVNGNFKSDYQQVFQQLLQLANLRTDPATAASILIKESNQKNILESIQSTLSRLIQLKSVQNSESIKNNEGDKPLIDLGNRLNFRQLYAFLDKVSHSKQLTGGPLDPLLALEDDLISWQLLFSN